ELVGLDLQYTRTADYESTRWINAAEAEVIVLGKGGKRRSVPVGHTALTAIQRWIEVRSQLASVNANDSDAHALFVGARGRRISPRVVQTQLAKLAQAAGLPAHVH